MTVTNWADLDRSVRIGFGDAILCMASIATLERGNQASALKTINGAGAGLSGRLIRDALFFRTHMLAARAFAPVRSRDDLHLRAAVDYLRQPDHLAHQSDPARSARLGLAVETFDSLDGSVLQKKVERMRNKELAHVAEVGEAVIRPLINELFEFARRTSQIWEEIAYGSGITSLSLESQVEGYRLSADRFWLHFERIDLDSQRALRNIDLIGPAETPD